MVSRKVSVPKDAVYQLMIVLSPKFIQPPIWRRILIPAQDTLYALHRTIQAAFGWTDSHLHLFECKGKTYSQPDMDIEETEDENRVRIEDVLKRAGAKVHYDYDFGDDWEHSVLLEKKLTREPEKFYPVCLDGARACPPEDCGGVWGYHDLCEAMKDAKHPDREDLLEWLGGVPYEPEAFNLRRINETLKRRV